MGLLGWLDRLAYQVKPSRKIDLLVVAPLPRDRVYQPCADSEVDRGPVGHLAPHSPGVPILRPQGLEALA
jgi:hypothetical protein